MVDWQIQRILEARQKARQDHKPGKTVTMIARTMPTYQVDTNLDWDTFAQVADRYSLKAQYQDRQDVSQDIILRLAELANTKPNRELTKPSMYRIASYVVMDYWHSQKRLFTTDSLNEQIEDSEGNTIELAETLADDKAIDLDDWLDCKTWLRGCPPRLIEIATKKAHGKPLGKADQKYLERYRQKDLAKRQLALP